MNVLGSFAVGILEQRLLIEGATLEMPRHRFLPRILQRATVGDLVWVKEPWFLFESSRYNCPQGIREAIPGNIAQGLNYPPHIKRNHGNLRMRPMGALTLAREDTRATLEILAIAEEAISLRVQMQQVDLFIKSRFEAA